MNKLIIKVFFIFIIFNCSQATSIEYQTTSPYWSTSKTGPASSEQAIEMFFKDRKLDIIEGIWTVQDWGLVAIVKDGSVYKEYNISVSYEDMNGTWHRTLIPTANSKVFTFFTQILWPDDNWYKFTTSKGKLILENENFGRDKIDKYAANPDGTLIRNWPTNFNDYNANITNVNESEYVTEKKWVKVAVSKDKEVTSYVDPKSIKKNGYNVTFTSLDSLAEGLEFTNGTAYSALDELEGNCTNYSARFLKSVYYQKKKGNGKIIHRNNSKSKWKNYKKTSMMGIVLSYACKKAKNEGFKQENSVTNSSQNEEEDDFF